MVLKEFLVALGLQDNMTAKLNNSMKSADSTISKFASGFAKKFALAGAAVVTFSATASVGLAKFATSLVKSDDALEAFAKKLGTSKEEAYKTKSALDVMGKSMKEVQLDPKLLSQFNELKSNAADLKLPDMTEGLNKVRAISTSVLTLKQTAMNALQWVGYSFLKYVAKPMEDIHKLLKGFNDSVKKNIPDWSDKIGKALSWVVQLGGTIIRAGAQMLGAVKKVFDAIPDGVKTAMVALGALTAFIKAGPIGKLTMIITLALLLLDDFFTHLDGGESLLGPVWQFLIDTFYKIRDVATEVWEKIKEVWTSVGKWAKGFWAEHSAKILATFSSVWTMIRTILTTTWNLIKTVAITVFNALRAFWDTWGANILTFFGETFDNVLDVIRGLADFISGVFSGDWSAAWNGVKTVFIGVFDEIGDVFTFVKDLIVNGFDLLYEKIGPFAAVIAGIAAAVGAYMLVTQAMAVVQGIMTAATSGLTIATIAHTVAEKAAAAAQWLLNAAMSANPIGLIIAAVAALVAIFITLWRNNEDFRNFFINCWEGIKNFFTALWEGISSFFSGIWDGIVGFIESAGDTISGIFTTIGDFFRDIWNGVKDFFAGLWDVITTTVTNAGETAKGIFSAVGDFFKGIWNGIADFFSGMWDDMVGFVTSASERIMPIFSTVGDFFKGIWENIKGTFSTVVEFFSDVFGRAVDSIKTVFNGVKEFFVTLFEAIVNIVKASINYIIEGINEFIEGLNTIQIPDWVPVVGGKGLSFPTISLLEKGGVLDKGQMGFLEGSGAEAVVPLEKNTEWIQKVAQTFVQKMGGGAEVMREAANYMSGTIPASQSKSGDKDGVGVADKLVSSVQTLTAALQSLTQALGSVVSSFVPQMTAQASNVGGSFDLSAVGGKIMTFLANSDRVMSQMSQLSHASTAYNAISNSNVNYNTTTIDNKQNYTIHDTSGNPRVTADMVSRTQALHNRNLKGVFA